MMAEWLSNKEVVEWHVGRRLGAPLIAKRPCSTSIEEANDGDDVVVLLNTLIT